MSSKNDLTRELRKRALSAGIDLIGITSIEPFRIRGEKETIVNPEEILPGAQSIIVAGFYIRNAVNILPSVPGKPRGIFTPFGTKVYTKMSAYCRKVISKFLRENGYKSVSSGKIPAKLAAVRSGLGKYGKNAVILTRELGSYVMFECLVSDAPLDYENVSALTTDCGDCKVCLEVCPAQAIYEPFKLDRARCITNWLWGTLIPVELREKQENRLFGCAECLKACPGNEHLKPRAEYPVPLEEVSDSPELLPLITGDSEYYRKVVPAFPRWAGTEAIRGNAIIALGNIADPAAVSALEETLRYPKPRIRAYSAWALGRIGNKKAREVLEESVSKERNKKVIEEVKNALG